MNYNDLKPCPDCGAHPRVVITEGQKGQYATIECRDDRHHTMVGSLPIDEALKEWNEGIIRHRPVLITVIEFVKK